MTDPWLEVRRQFRLDPEVLHFGAFWLSSYPKPVRDAIDAHRLAIDRNPVFYILDNELKFDREVRRALAAYTGGCEDRIVLTESTTEGLSLSVGMLRLNADDEILTTTHEHYSAQSAVNQLRLRSGAKVRQLALYDHPTLADPVQMAAKLLDAIEESTRLVVLTWVHSGTGVRIPLEVISNEIAARNRSRSDSKKVMLCVDATHGFGALDIDLARSPCDMFVSSCHKWLNGPHGTGFVYFSDLALDLTDPIIPSFSPGPLGRFTGRPPALEAPWERVSPGGFHAFENRWAVPAAIDFANSIGKTAIEHRICALAARIKAVMRDLGGVRLVTPEADEVSAGIICFEVGALGPEQVVQELRHRSIVASVSPYHQRYARLTPGIYNTDTDVDQLLDQLTDLSAHYT